MKTLDITITLKDELAWYAFLSSLIPAFVLSSLFYIDRLLNSPLSVLLFTLIIALFSGLTTYLTVYWYSIKVSNHLTSAWHMAVIAFLSYMQVTALTTVFRALFFPSQWHGVFTLGLAASWYPIIIGWLIGYQVVKSKPLRSLSSGGG